MGGDALFLRTPEYMFEVYRDDPVKLSAYLSICLIYKRYDLIETTINLFNLRSDNNYSKFIKINNILRKRLNFADRISRVSNHGIRFFFVSMLIQLLCSTNKKRYLQNFTVY